MQQIGESLPRTGIPQRSTELPWLFNHLMQMDEKEASSEEIGQFIQESLDNGTISREQAEALREALAVREGGTAAERNTALFGVLQRMTTMSHEEISDDELNDNIGRAQVSGNITSVQAEELRKKASTRPL